VQFGLLISIILHVGVLGWALINIHSSQQMSLPEIEPIALDLITTSELTKLRQGARNAEQLEAEAKENPKVQIAKKETLPPKPTAAPPPPPPEPPAPTEQAEPEPPKPAADEPVQQSTAAPAEPPPPPPGPTPDEQKKLEEKLQEDQRIAEEQKRAEQQRQIEEQRKVEEKRKAEEKRKLELERQKKLAEEKKKKEEQQRKSFNNMIANALKNAPEDAQPKAQIDRTAPQGGITAPRNDPVHKKAAALGAPEGRDMQLSASEIAVLAQIIKSCVQSKWSILGGGESAETAIVKMRLRFNPDGTLEAPPQIMNPQSTAYFLAVSDSAVRAVEACEPFNLPPAKYEIWKDIVLNFNPHEMF
jgi:colicin import membrane protein